MGTVADVKQRATDLGFAGATTIHIPIHTIYIYIYIYYAGPWDIFYFLFFVPVV